MAILKMSGTWYLACLLTLFITYTEFVCSDVQFMERPEGESVVLPCVVKQRKTLPFGVYLKRSWLQPSEVLFMYMKSNVTVNNNANRNRISASGDPSRHSVNVTISQLSATDTDRYHCEFVFSNPSGEDEHIHGDTEFFLLVRADDPRSADVELVETCAGGSAVLPCLPPPGEGSAVEGFSLKRQRGRGPVEVLYHSKRPSSSQFPIQRVHLSSAPGPGGITYNLTLQQLQPEDSALYSCQLLLPGRPDSSTRLGIRVFFVSVQDGQCSCSSYSSLLYALSSAVAVLLLLLIGFVVIHKGKAGRRVKSHPQAPIYEEMTGIQPHSRKLQEMEPSEYRKKSCSDNHYESPSSVLHPWNEK